MYSATSGHPAAPTDGLSIVEQLRERYERLAQDPDPATRRIAVQQFARLANTQPAAAAHPDDPGPRGDLAALIIRTVGKLDLRPNGTEVGPCPFHASHSGRCLVLFPGGTRWWCSSCKRGGTALTWLRLAEGLSSQEAARQLGLLRGIRPARRRLPLRVSVEVSA